MKLAFIIVLLLSAISDACWRKDRDEPELIPGSVGNLSYVETPGDPDYAYKSLRKQEGLVAPIAERSCTEGPYISTDDGAGRNDAWNKSRPGIHQCVSRWKQGDFVTGLEIWASKWHIHGIKFNFKDKKPYTIGVQNCGDGDIENDDHHAIWDFEGKNITKFFLGDNSKHGARKGDALAGIGIEVGGQKLQVGPDTKHMKEIDVGEGNLLGGHGWVDGQSETGTASPGGMLRSFYPFFLGRVQKDAEAIDIHSLHDLEVLNEAREGLTSTHLDEIWYVNTDFPEGARWAFQGRSMQSWSKTFSTMNQNMFGGRTAVNFQITGGFPAVTSYTAGLEVEFNYQRTEQSISTDEETYQHEISWDFGSTQSQSLVDLGHAMHCVARSGQGVYNGGYMEKVSAEVDGNWYNFTREGSHRSNTFTGAMISCKRVNSSDVPLGAKMGTVVSQDGSLPLVANAPYIGAKPDPAKPVYPGPSQVVAGGLWREDGKDESGPVSDSVNSVNTPASTVDVSVKPVSIPVSASNAPVETLSTLASIVNTQI